MADGMAEGPLQVHENQDGTDHAKEIDYIPRPSDPEEQPEGFIKKGEVSDGILNMVEMAFRAYDPCYACATHTLPGQMPLDIKIYNKNRAILHNIRRP